MKFYCLVFLVFLFVGCNKYNANYFSNDYKKEQFYSSNVAIIPDISKFISQKDKDNLYETKIIKNKPISEMEKQIVKKYFHLVFEENSYTTCQNIDGTNENSDISFEQIVTISSSNRKNKFYLPTQNFEKIKSDFLFIIQDISFKIESASVGSTLGSAGTNLFYLNGELEYVLFNKNKKEIVSFGINSEKIASFKAPTNEDYLKLLNLLVSKIVTNTPFKKKNKILY